MNGITHADANTSKKRKRVSGLVAKNVELRETDNSQLKTGSREYRRSARAEAI